MHRSIFAFTVLALCLTAFAAAQTRRAGLYETISTMEFKRAPFLQMPGAAASSLSAPHTSQVCVSQAMLDKYNGVVERPGGVGGRQQDCKITSTNKTANSMTAQMVCTGHTDGKADIEMTWSDASHYTGTVHFIGQMQMGAQSQPFEYVVHVTSTYKGADCGSIKPLDMPTD